MKLYQFGNVDHATGHRLSEGEVMASSADEACKTFMADAMRLPPEGPLQRPRGLFTKELDTLYGGATRAWALLDLARAYLVDFVQVQHDWTDDEWAAMERWRRDQMSDDRITLDPASPRAVHIGAWLDGASDLALPLASEADQVRLAAITDGITWSQRTAGPAAEIG